MSRHIEVFNPQRALDIVTRHNGTNRPVKKMYVRILADAIIADKWQLNGETIKFGADGMLYDGQHRLHAVILADKAIRSYVIHGLEEGVFDTIDRGFSRKNSDLLARAGYANYCALAAAIRWMWLLDGDSLRSPDKRMREDEVIGIATAHPRLGESVTKAIAVKKVMQVSICALCHYQFSAKDPQLADRFIKAIADGENLGKSNPFYLLREILLGNRKTNRKLLPMVVLCMCRKAWNAARTGKTIKNLSWKVNENIPGVE